MQLAPDGFPVAEAAVEMVEGVLVDTGEVVGAFAPAELAGLGDGGLPHGDAGVVVTEELTDGVGPVGGVVAGDEGAGFAIGDDDRQAADGCRDNRSAGGLGFDGDEAERFVVAGHGDDVGGLVDVHELLGRPRPEEAHDVAHALLLGESLIRIDAHPATGGAAADEDAQGVVDAVTNELADGPDEHLRALELLEAADEGNHLSVDGDAEVTA